MDSDNYKQLDNLIEQLDVAKGNVRELLENGNRIIGMHGIEYWAGEVQRDKRLKGEDNFGVYNNIPS